MKSNAFEFDEAYPPDHWPLLRDSHESLFWLTTAEKYRQMGVLNKQFTEDLINLSILHTVHSKKPLFNLSKAIFDRVIATLLLVVSSPIFLIVAILIKLEDRGPIFYRQVRYGRYFEPFWIIKFRTMRFGAHREILFMNNEMTHHMFKQKDDQRITRVGKFLRVTSLDELPQLLNVLMGTMSLVGPRPLPAEDNCTIPYSLFVRFATKPGITGLWQVAIRGSADGLEKLRYDCTYVHTRSWATDLKILAKTVPVVLSQTGAH